MDESHKLLQERTLRMFVGKLDATTMMLNSYARPVAVDAGLGIRNLQLAAKPLKYALRKEQLDDAIDVLETWQRLSDPSWFLILKMNDHQIDDALQSESQLTTCIPTTSVIRGSLQPAVAPPPGVKGLSLSKDMLQNMEISDIPVSEAQIAQHVRSDKVLTYILSRAEPTEQDSHENRKRDIRDLARRLQHDEPESFGILACKGFVTEKTDPTMKFQSICTMVFRVPSGLSNPRSLRDYLASSRKPTSLSHRFSLARDIAKSVNYVHVLGFVHKNIRPEALLCFEAEGTDSPSLFLAGFEQFRKEEGMTYRTGDDAVEKNLYRHPTRQGFDPTTTYVMQHDIYSLGVCLLEVGLWSSFIVYDAEGLDPRLSELFTPGIHDDESKEEHHFNLASSKALFVQLARTKLRECMGTKYSEVVETCLTCLDMDNIDFGDPREFEDEDGIRVGVRYIEKVLTRLNSLVV